MINPKVIANQEGNRKDVAIINLKLQNEQLKNELRHEKENMERVNKPNESIKDFKYMMNYPRAKDTLDLDSSNVQLLKKENHPKVENKGMQNKKENLHFITLENWTHNQYF